MSGEFKDMNRRIEKGIKRGRSFEIEVDGEKVVAYEGETIAAAILVTGKRIFRKTTKEQSRGIYCGAGICYECRMIVNGRPNVRVCQTMATPNCKVQTQIGLGTWEDWR